MTISETYFFDTYALIEIIGGAESYKNYTNSEAVITKLNLFELYYKLLKMHAKERALFYMVQYVQFVMDFDENDITAAAGLKYKNKKLSITDCVGYVVALKNNIKFLTGDKEFEDMPNVEFVK